MSIEVVVGISRSVWLYYIHFEQEKIIGEIKPISQFLLLLFPSYIFLLPSVAFSLQKLLQSLLFVVVVPRLDPFIGLVVVVAQYLLCFKPTQKLRRIERVAILVLRHSQWKIGLSKQPNPVWFWWNRSHLNMPIYGKIKVEFIALLRYAFFYKIYNFYFYLNHLYENGFVLLVCELHFFPS